MNKNVNYILKKYNKLLRDEIYENIMKEMLTDLKQLLLENCDNTYDRYFILESFFNINYNTNELIDNLNNYFIIKEDIDISTLKRNFNDKHAKILNRDKKWLNTNKTKILGLNFDEIELEVLSDYKVTFEQLINRHNIFDKIFVNSENIDNLDEKLHRFEDKNGNLKNGLDNYFRTGTSRREIGLRKVSGQEAKTVVENMIEYCDSFLSGKSFLEEKMNKIIVDISDSNIKENYSILDLLKEVTDNIKSEDSNNEPIDNNEESNNKSKEIDSDKPTRGINDRQIGIAVLLTVAEERYFDYINILKGLIE